MAIVRENNLRILNAESYDDDWGRLRDERWINKSKNMLRLSVDEQPQIELDSPVRPPEEHESVSRCKRARTEARSQDEDIKGKARGRPMASPKDESAADRRRTQIRMAQRAYRHRKESTISSLEKKVQYMTKTREEMNSSFIALYDFAVNKGLVQREPEFGQQLRATTQRFLALAKASADDTHDENQEGSAKHDEAETGRCENGQKGSPKHKKEMTQPVSSTQPGFESLTSQPTPTYGAYVLSNAEVPELNMAYAQQDQSRDHRHNENQYRAHESDNQIITLHTEDNASFPFNFRGQQQYRAELSAAELFSRDFLLQSQLLPPKFFAYNELSFSRRIHRGAIEKALSLVTSDDPTAQECIQSVFRFSLMYSSKEDIVARLRMVMGGASEEDILQNWPTPSAHVDGSGTQNALHKNNKSQEPTPKPHARFSVGPFSPSVAAARDVLDRDMKCDVRGFEGHFINSDDVEGYLRGRGLDIAPTANFVTINIDMLRISDPSTPKTFGSYSKVSNNFLQSSNSPMGFLAKTSAIAYQDGNNRTVTINVNLLLDEIIKRGVCLGFSQKFRQVDIDAALIAAARAGF